MNLYLATLLQAVLVPWLLGAAAVRCLGLRADGGWTTFWGWSYLVGQLLLAPVTLLWLWLDQPVPGQVLPWLAAAAAAALWWLGRRRAGDATDVGPKPAAARWERWLLALVLALLSAQLIDLALTANLEPEALGDGANIWASKAKALYVAERFDLAFALGSFVSHADYPLFNPLVQVWAFAGAGQVLQFENRLPIQAFGLALLLLAAGAARRHLRPAVAAPLLVLLCASDLQWLLGSVIADVMLAAGLLGAADAWLRFRAAGHPAWWRLMACGLAVALGAKNEGAMLVLALLLAAGIGVLLDRRGAVLPRPRRALGWLLLPAAAIAVHRWFNTRFGLHNDLFDPAMAGGRTFLQRLWELLPVRSPQVAAWYGRMFVDADRARLVFPALLLAALARPGRVLRGPAGVPLLAVAGGLSGYALVFVATPFLEVPGREHATGLSWHLSTAGARTAFHVLPLAWLGLAMALAELWPWARAVRTADDRGPQRNMTAIP